PDRESPALGPWEETVRGWLEADLGVPRKQRHTARRVWQRLVEEHGAGVAESTVRPFVAEVKAELANEVRRVAVPQTKELGQEAEVDFGEFHLWLEGVLTRGWMFVMRLSASGRAFHRAYLNEAAEAFYDGHVRAFEHFGGVPTGHIRYDNLASAVTKVLLGREREHNPRFVALRSTYGFDSWFCLPGREGSHEKGGVEGEIGRFRRRHFVPVPVVGSLEELNRLIEAADAVDDGRRIEHRLITVGEHFALERGHLAPLPAEPFDVATYLQVRVDHKARVCVRQAFYSVPARLAGRRLEVRLGAATVEVRADGKRVARHERSHHRGSETLVLDHYLEVLRYKPGALPGATALAQARAAGAFTPAHDAYWSRARRRRGDKDGTRALIEVLLAHRSLPADALVEALTAAVEAEMVDPAAVIVEARRRAEGRVAPVVPIGALRHYDRPLPVLGGYDELLEDAR
ncbi:MAG: IS21 family transposase, partial [Acidimicrobiia bacterium]